MIPFFHGGFVEETQEQVEHKKQKLDEFFIKRADLLKAWLREGKDPNQLPVWFNDKSDSWEYINRKDRRKHGIR